MKYLITNNKNLGVVTVCSMIIAALMIISSIIGIGFQSELYITDKILVSFFPTDWFNLLVGVPVLLVCMLLAHRGKLIGLLCWPGVLFYGIYIYIPYIFVVPYHALFPVYLLIVTISIYTMIGVLLKIDGNSVKQRIEKGVSRRAAAGILIGLALLIIVRQMALMVGALSSDSIVEMQEIALWVDDFMVASPALLVGGWMLLKKKALGYVVGAGTLMAYGLLSVSLLPYFVFQASYHNTALDIPAMVVIAFMAIICFLPFVSFVRAASSK